MRDLKIVFAVVLLGALLAAPAGADVYLEQENSHSGSSTSNQPSSGMTKMWISENSIRIEVSSSGTVHITDLAGARLITLDRTKREFFIIPLEQVRADLKRASERLKQRMHISWRIERIGEQETISGFDCMPIVFRGSGSLEQGGNFAPLDISVQFWVSRNTPISYDVFLKLMDVIGISQNPFMDTQVLNELRDLGGYPIKTVTSIKFEGVNDRIEQTVKVIREVEHDPSLYAIPEGYTEADKPIQAQ